MVRKKETFLVLWLLALAVIPADAKQTVGLFVNEEGAFDGYTLFAPINNTTTYLINNEGLLVHSWENDYAPGLSAYLSKDGYLYRSICVGSTSRFEDFGGGVEKLDWEGNVVWHYEYSNEEHRQHHDIEVLPSGNVLMVAWEHKDYAEAVANGRDTSLLKADGLWPDHIVEVKQTGDSTGEIVWEWHVWDHLVQEFDSTKDGYGVVENYPSLININWTGIFGVWVDWNHLNAVAYNEEFDQIVLSSREFNEFWVIDHSTTTAEARGHTGGQRGKGGDILYRWGNPQAYDRGTSADRRLYEQHDVQWIPSGYPGAGNILLFNNGTSRWYSSVDEIVPPVDGQGNYTGGLPYGPQEPLWYYTAPNLTDFYSFILSGAERMPNGNTLICTAMEGEFFEVTPEGDVVWRYINPVTDKGPLYQGDSMLFPGENAVFKVRRYSPDFPGLAGKDLTPGGPIEKYSAVEESTAPSANTSVTLEIRPPYVTHTATITYQLGVPGHVEIKLYNVLGQEIKTLVDEAKPAGDHAVVWNARDNNGQKLNPGIYFCTLESGNATYTSKIILGK